MNETLLIALVVAVIGPVILSILNGRQRRKEKLLDYERQDQVAERARIVANEAAAKAAEAARLLLKANERVARTAKTTNNKLDVIHTLVNSNMTAAMQAELDATKRELAMMREVIQIKRANGKQPTKEVLGAVEATQSKISELQAQLKDRMRQAKLVEKQQQAQKDGDDQLVVLAGNGARNGIR